MNARNQALAQRQEERPQLVGSFRGSRAITARLQEAKNRYHLVAPATSVGTIPEGCAVAITMVEIDTRDMRHGGELYNVGGNFALARSALNRIAQAAGISWDPQLSRRIDDGSDPYYAHFRAVGTLRTFDGTELMVTGEKEMDLRDGSPQVHALAARKRDGGSIENQLRELRLHILAHAESKAKNRAIRSIGLRASYKRDDLKKPFVVAKLMWTGETSDPDLKREFARLTAQRMLGGPRAMFSAAPTPAPAMTPSTAPALKAPPPVGTVAAEADDVAPAFATPPPSGGRTTIDAPRAAPVAADSSPTAPSRTDHVIPGGKSKGTPLADADDEALAYWEQRIGNALAADETPERYRARDESLVQAIRAEIHHRQGGVAPEDEPGWDGDGDGEGGLY
ncbi:MAG: hypothetical protein AAF715_19495 [Myxococcota bacterium]